MSFLKILESMVVEENEFHYQMNKTEERGT